MFVILLILCVLIKFVFDCLVGINKLWFCWMLMWCVVFKFCIKKFGWMNVYGNCNCLIICLIWWCGVIGLCLIFINEINMICLMWCVCKYLRKGYIFCLGLVSCGGCMKKIFWIFCNVVLKVVLFKKLKCWILIFGYVVNSCLFLCKLWVLVMICIFICWFRYWINGKLIFFVLLIISIFILLIVF